jgi:hypothetical protein
MIALTVVHLAHEVAHIPKSISLAIHDRQQRREKKAREIERLDRIRNPSDYLGK